MRDMEKKFANNIIGKWLKNHEEMYEKLEELIDTDLYASEIYTDITKNFIKTQKSIKTYAELSKEIVGGLKKEQGFEGCIKDEKRYKLVESLRSAIYDDGYCALKIEEFAKLFKALVESFSSVMNRGKIAEKMGISANDIALISGGKERKPSVKEQKSILNTFYDLCFDPLKNEIAEFTNERELLETLLGRDLCIHERRFYDIYFYYCANKNKEMEELSKLSEIRLVDLHKIVEGILKINPYPYYPQKLHHLSCIMLERSDMIVPKDQLDRIDRWYVGILKQKHLDDDLKWENEEKEDDEKQRIKEAGDWFIKIPDIFKDFVYEYACAQSEADINNAYFHDYIKNHGSMAFSDFYNHRKLILYVIRAFKRAPAVVRQNLLEFLHLNVTISLPAPSYEKYPRIVWYPDSRRIFSECAVFSFFMSTFTKSHTLSDMFRDAPKNTGTVDRNDYLWGKYEDSYVLAKVGLDHLNKVIDFTATDWLIAGYIEAAIANKYPLDAIFEILEIGFYEEDYNGI